MHPTLTRHRILVLTLAAAAAASCASACRSNPASAPAAAVSANTWAVVDGRSITRDDVEKAFRRIGDPSQTLSDEETITAKLGVLDNMIVEDILLAKAGVLKLAVPDTEIETAYNQGKGNMPDDAFQKELERRNLTSADMREGIRRQLLAKKVVDQEVGSKIAVSDEEITSFFNANRAQFNLAEDVYRIAQIIVTPTREPQLANRTGDDAATPEAAAAKVRMLMERLMAGAPFGDIARDYSEDPESAPRGGDMGGIPLSRVNQAPPALRDAVLKVAPGNARVVTQGGIHTIVYVVGRESAGQKDLSMPSIRQNITDMLRERKDQMLRTAYLNAVRDDATVENYLARRVVDAQGKVPALAP